MRGVYIRNCCLVLYAILVFARYFEVLDCLIHCSDQKELTKSIALGFVSVTIPISVYHSFDHWLAFCRPDLQSQVIRIIWLVNYLILID